MDSIDNIMVDICNREIQSKLLSIRIDGIPVYYYVRRYTRIEILKQHGHNIAVKHPPVEFLEHCKSVIKSIFQISKLLLSRKKYDIFIYSFGRPDKVNGIYMDKFTDPLIEESNIGNSYVVFEPSRAWKHLTPRMHKDNVIYSDAIYWMGNNMWKFYKKRYEKRNRNELISLYEELVRTFPEVKYNFDSIVSIIIRNYLYYKYFHNILKRIEAKSLVAPSRADFYHIIPVAKKLNMKVIELQHGITYGETPTYSGFNDILFSPDYFLSFGNVHSANCYGISDDKVFEIGWAFNNYIQKLKKGNEDVSKIKVLVISSPSISEKMVSVTCMFAEKHPDIHFYFRPHPSEQLDGNRLNRLNSCPNITIDNNQENVMVTILMFDNVMGENSTVLYEALSMGKKVGKVQMEGLEPRYLTEDDKSFFYQITDDYTFMDFIKASLDAKPSKKLYTEFKSEVINQLLEDNKYAYAK